MLKPTVTQISNGMTMKELVVVIILLSSTLIVVVVPALSGEGSLAVAREEVEVA